MRTIVFTAVVGLAACGGTPEPSPAPTTPSEPAAAPLGDKIEVPAAAVEAKLSVPTPSEVQAQVRKAGIADDLAAVVPTWSFHFDRNEPNVVAVRVGVLLADLVLVARSEEAPKLAARLTHLHQGLTTLKAKPTTLTAVEELRSHVEAGALTGDALFAALDDLGTSITRGEEDPIAVELIRLVEAGVWLEGVYCVTDAIKAHGDASAADDLLRQSEVLDYFTPYARAAGIEGASMEQAATLMKSLSTMHDIVGREAPLDMEAVEGIHTAVDDILTEV